MTSSSERPPFGASGTPTFYDAPPPVEELVGLKDREGLTIGVCLPALDEEATVGAICSTISTELKARGLVDQLVVVDSGSTDSTIDEAASAGAEVVKAADLVPSAPRIARPGKGESLWKSLAIMETDLIVWLDSDTRNFTAKFVSALVAPLLGDRSIVFTKAFYDRPIDGAAGLLPMGGARVTELSTRPLINLLYPELAGFIQPLSGEYAGRREALLDLPFGIGYDVDLLLLIELVERHGIGAIAQVDLGSRVHRNRDIPALGRMSFEIVRAFLERLDEDGRLKVADALPEEMVQFTDRDGGRTTSTYSARSEKRPPMRTFLEI